MYAVVKIGTRQLRVSAGDIIRINKVSEVHQRKKEFLLKNVLFFKDGKNLKVGAPLLKDVKITAQFLNELKGPKITAYKYRRRKSSHCKKGHRHSLIKIKIKDIKLESKQ